MRPRTLKSAPNRPRNVQEHPTSAPRSPQEHLRTSRMPQDWPKSNPKAPKLVPRPPSECPKDAQKRPNSAPRAPKRTQERRKNDPKAPHVEDVTSQRAFSRQFCLDFYVCSHFCSTSYFGKSLKNHCFPQGFSMFLKNTQALAKLPQMRKKSLEII